jgi:cysteine synthase A
MIESTVIRDRPFEPTIEPTPLVNVEGVLAKIEFVNPCGSIKDRIALYILKKSEELGLLRPGMRIVEATSGNTGIAMAYYGRALGYPVTIVMPEHMTEERKGIIKSLGADLILCSEAGSFAEAAAIRDTVAAASDRVFNPDQFSNPLNALCHQETTAQELISQAGVKIDAFVAGVGTGGTLMGVGQALRELWPDVRLAALEPAEAAVMTGGAAGSHYIFGIGDGFIPSLISDGQGGVNAMVDEVIVISSADALEAARMLGQDHGLCVGISSGANFLAAKQLQERFGTVATVFADGAVKYQSHGLGLCTDESCQFRARCEKAVVAPVR